MSRQLLEILERLERLERVASLPILYHLKHLRSIAISLPLLAILVSCSPAHQNQSQALLNFPDNPARGGPS